MEPSLSNINLDIHYQFLRIGYFVFDKNANKERLIFNQTTALRSNWGENTP